jgi:hypothetical protein
MIPMLFESPTLDSHELDEKKRMALEHILDAWQDALQVGIEPDVLASAAMFTALSDLIEAYGEEPVAKMTRGLPNRIRLGEFTIDRTVQ